MAPDSPYWNLDLSNALLIATLTSVPVLLTTWLVTSRQQARRRWGLRVAVLGILLLGCPCTQWVALEPVHMHRLERLADKARSVNLQGMRKDEIEALLGPPTWVDHDGGPGSETWEYQPVPFYVMGQTLQVHFEGGVVTHWKDYYN
jgi:hypothetical protein